MYSPFTLRKARSPMEIVLFFEWTSCSLWNVITVVGEEIFSCVEQFTTHEWKAMCGSKNVAFQTHFIQHKLVIRFNSKYYPMPGWWNLGLAQKLSSSMGRLARNPCLDGIKVRLLVTHAGVHIHVSICACMHAHAHTPGRPDKENLSSLLGCDACKFTY